MSDPIQPPPDEFARLFRQNLRVPVARTLLADTLTPVAAYDLLVRQSPEAVGSFLFESVTGGEHVGRYSFLGVSAAEIVEADIARAGDLGGLRRHAPHGPVLPGDPLKLLEQVLREEYPAAPLKGLPRFTGGAVGYLGYDVVRLMYGHKLPRTKPLPAHLKHFPDLLFMLFDRLLIFDHARKTVSVVALSSRGRADAAADEIDRAREIAAGKVDELARQLHHASVSANLDVSQLDAVQPLPYTSNFTPAQFEDGVRRAKEYIKAGDIIQVVLSQRLTAHTHADPFTIYRALRAVNPSPYMVLMTLPGDRYVIGASPEMMVRVEGRTIETRPIAGTRRRGATEDEDERLAAELAGDPKELAEHTMLLDLGRNDIGRVAEYGSVEIDKPYSIEHYSHVMHIVSGVKGRLKPGLTAFDVLRSCLPAGTLSGAPKVRAMQIIDEIEPDARGPYGGAVGYFDCVGNHDSCIAIRTLVGVGNEIQVQSGAGIVADSDPKSEYQETLAKAKAMLNAVALADRWTNAKKA